MTAATPEVFDCIADDIQPACDNEHCDRPAEVIIHYGCGCIPLMCQPCLTKLRAQIRGLAEQFWFIALSCHRCGWSAIVPNSCAEYTVIRSVEAL
jgi:hypothetical protein